MLKQLPVRVPGLIALLLLVLALDHAPASTGEQGLPFISWYPPQAYGAGTQNWAIAQDDSGVMYFGNDSVVLVYDGARWERVMIAPGLAIRSLALADDGRILVGSQSEFGYLTTDAFGNTRYQSLIDRLPDDAPEFTDIWKVLVDGDNWYFSAAQALFHFTADNVQVYPHTRDGAGGSFLISGQLYTDFPGTGLKMLSTDGYQPVPVSSPNLHVYAMQPMGDGRILIGTYQQGLYVYDPASETIDEIAPHTSEYLAQHHIYYGTVLPDGRHALATLRGGLVVTDPLTDEYEVLDRDKGLPDITLRHLYVDTEGGLWIATDSGIARIEPQAVISRWAQHSGLEGPVLSLKRFQGILHAGTTLGLFRLIAGQFEAIEGIDSEVWHLLDWTLTDGQSRLLAATSYGVYEVKEQSAELVTDPYLSMSLAVVPSQPERVWIGSYDRGLGYIEWIDGEYTGTDFIGLDVAARRLGVDAGGKLWLETWLNGLFVIDPGPAVVLWQFPEPDSEMEKTGLTFLVNERHQLIASPRNLWQRHADGTMVAQTQLRERMLAPRTGASALVEGRPNVLWAVATDGVTSQVRVAHLDAPDRPVPIDSLLARLPDVEFYTIFPEDNQVWIGGSESLYRVDLTRQPSSSGNFRAFWRSIRSGAHFLPLDQSAGAPELDSSEFPLVFRFAAPSYDWPAGTRFRHRLPPLYPRWSEWQQSGDVQFTHLPAGNYHLEVQARNVYGQIASTDPFAFLVPPPWYLNRRTLAATGAALVVMIPGLLWLGGWRQSRRSARLEKLVARRTVELRQQQALLRKERDKLDYLSRHDDLTALHNRRHGNERLEHAWQSAVANGEYVSLALMDVDHFKQINDHLGHEMGDRTLIEIAGILKVNSRPNDVVVRWGGEEFLLLFPGTGLPDAAAICHRINDLITARDWSALTGDLPVTVSTGVTATRGEKSVTELLRRADELLFRAKQQGRNRVEVERESW